MRKSSNVYTQEDIQRFSSFHDVTDNGVVFDWGLASSEGAWFVLIKQKGQTMEDIRVAARQIRRDHDVVWLGYAIAEEPDPDQGHDGHELEAQIR